MARTTGPLAVVSVSAGLSAWWAMYHPMGRSPLYLLEALAVVFMIEVPFLEVAMLAVCLVIKLNGNSFVAWRAYDFGILEGFGISGLLTLPPYLGRVIFGFRFEEAFRYAPIGVYAIATVYWLLVFVQRELPLKKVELRFMQEQTAVLEKLTKLLGSRHYDPA